MSTGTIEVINVSYPSITANGDGDESALSSAIELLKGLVEEEFECAVCLDICTDSHVIPECLHRFCGVCIKESLRKCNNECPTCRAHVTTRRDLRKDTKFDTIVSTNRNVYK